MELFNHPPIILWLEQFGRDSKDQSLANLMLEKFRYVSNQDLRGDISQLLLTSIPKNQVAAIYIERELQTTRNKNPIKMYREIKIKKSGIRKKALRATGAAQAVVKSSRNDRQTVGSEGILANHMSQLCSQNSKRFILHPSAELIRTEKIRHVVIVTDFIGSGNRIQRMLTSLWQVRSIRSWHSGRFIKFSIYCYSGTKAGIAKVERHRTKPKIQMVLPCPTLKDSFNNEVAQTLRDLCVKYSPGKNPLGYDDCGALIAFEHGCPNNLPGIFIEKSSRVKKPWQPLFEKRSSMLLSNLEKTLKSIENNSVLEALSFENIITASSYLKSSIQRKGVTLLLATLARGHRHINQIVSESRMSLAEITLSLSVALELGLIDLNRRLTKAGFRELRKLNKTKIQLPSSNLGKIYYHPRMLRAPSK